MLFLSSIPSGLELWSVNYTSVYEHSELNVFKYIKCLGKMSSNWPNDLLGIHIYIYTRLLNLIDNHCWQYNNGLIILQ